MNPAALVTVAIPTRNRHAFIAAAIDSVLAQTFRGFRLLVLDNSTNRLTEDVVRAYSDARIEYVRAGDIPDVISCWNECISLCNTPYLHLFSDDDRIYPAFLERSIAFHTSHPNIALSFTHAYKVDEDLQPVCLWGYEFPSAGVLSGTEYLTFTFTHACCITLAPTVVIRSDIHREIGPYRSEYATNTFDFNLYLRVAMKHDVGFIAEPLADYRLHADQLTALHWRQPELPTGRIGTLLELLAALGEWEQSSAAPTPDFARDRRKYLLRELSRHLRQAIPSL